MALCSLIVLICH